MTECFKRGLVCPNGTICGQASDGSYGCVCHKGFEMVLVGGNKTCKDIDECKHRHSCPTNSSCVNSEGSYQCTCNPGFSKMNGTGNCEELKKGNCSCGKHEECHQQKCRCKKGYEKNKDGNCAPGLGPKHGTSHKLQSGQWETGVSRSSCTTGHVILLLFGLLWYQAFA
ncbi:EGF-like module-containing mucin-like hormone receptor-like [Desmophyllum pertusum]|uniref:EGF-like module-containing mucin-like hormone receptor-like n=1 Tax=Desmophyllum pertusum TaxID=174260 RepID=A0A9X0A693_9CNID|nr:EGF-like module-containing mucin-like hormone receptor-like [Desmophyllum pertusum]